MALYHGTSAGSALKIIQSRMILPSKDGFFYCFDSEKPESLAGALCFATGDGPRNGSLRGKNFFAQYAKLNPDFPTGLKGIFYKAALKHIAITWAKAQMAHATGPLDKQAAILVFDNHPLAISRTRNGFVNEMKIAGEHTKALNLECAYFDDALLNTPDIQRLHGNGMQIKPLSQVTRQLNL